MDWKLALKVGGASSIAVWLIFELLMLYFSTSEIFKNSLVLNLVVLFVIFAFCMTMGWLWGRIGGGKAGSEGVKDNIILDNDVDENIEVGVGAFVV